MTEVKRGLDVTRKFHDENTGAPYKTVMIKEAGQFVCVRVLQKEDLWVSLFMHRDWSTKVPSTRCVEQTDEPDMEKCELCAHDIGRQLRTFIPVRVRGDENQGRVQFFDYGRDNLAEVVNQLEELGKDQSITDIDFKVKRQGKGVDTKYRWVPSGENDRPLNESELALVVPDLAELIPIPSEAKVRALVRKFTAGASSTDDETEEEDEKPSGGKKSPF